MEIRRSADRRAGLGSGPPAAPRERLKKTSMRLPDELLRDLKMASVLEGSSVQEICREAIAPHVAKILDRHGQPRTYGA